MDIEKIITKKTYDLFSDVMCENIRVGISKTKDEIPNIYIVNVHLTNILNDEYYVPEKYYQYIINDKLEVLLPPELMGEYYTKGNDIIISTPLINEHSNIINYRHFTYFGKELKLLNEFTATDIEFDDYLTEHFLFIVHNYNSKPDENPNYKSLYSIPKARQISYEFENIVSPNISREIYPNNITKKIDHNKELTVTFSIVANVERYSKYILSLIGNIGLDGTPRGIYSLYNPIDNVADDLFGKEITSNKDLEETKSFLLRDCYHLLLNQLRHEKYEQKKAQTIDINGNLRSVRLMKKRKLKIMNIKISSK